MIFRKLVKETKNKKTYEEQEGYIEILALGPSHISMRCVNFNGKTILGVMSGGDLHLMAGDEVHLYDQKEN